MKHVVKKLRDADVWAVYRESSESVRGVQLVRWFDTWRGVEFLRWFDTWREAMDYADRRARTVEVVLPRRTVLPTDRHVVQTGGLIIEYRGSRSYPNLDTGHIAVEPEERRPLALALLALAEKEETQA